MKRSASMAGGVTKPRKEDGGGGGEEERGGEHKVISTGDKITIIILYTVYRRVS